MTPNRIKLSACCVALAALAACNSAGGSAASACGGLTDHQRALAKSAEATVRDAEMRFSSMEGMPGMATQFTQDLQKATSKLKQLMAASEGTALSHAKTALSLLGPASGGGMSGMNSRLDQAQRFRALGL